MKKKRFKLHTLGCRTNQYETQAYRDQLLKLGYEEAGIDQEAELCLVNTCTVTAQAEKSSQQVVKQFLKKNPKAKVLVTGCAVEGIGKKEGFETLSPSVHVTLNKQKEDLLKEALNLEKLPEFSIKRFEAHTRAFVKVQDGCNSFCSYCIIPYVRGRSRSKSKEQILNEVKALVANGYKEVVLTGINIGDFDGAQEPAYTLANLVTDVDKVPGLERLRVSSIDPDEVDEALVKAILEGKNTCHSMHIVLQSGSNAVLKRMNRKYTRQMFFQSVDTLKACSPDFTFTTDVIVGFPGESDFDHGDTLEAIKEVGFIKVHMFPYSKRPRTKAALFKDPVAPETIQSRKQEILRVSENVAFSTQERFLGREVQVLIEAKSHKGLAFGHSKEFLPVWVKSSELEANTMHRVRLIENSPKGMIGELI